jgi:hypothetical protein
MKKTLLLSAVLIALTASLASAAGLNLSWSGCGTAGLQDMTDLCDANTLLGNWHLFGSAISPTAVAGPPLFTAHRSWVDFENANPTLDDWWKMAPGDCRAGQYAPSHTSATMGGGAPCVKTILGTGLTAAINNWTDNSVGNSPANTARLDMIAARADVGGSVNTTSQYMLFDLNILGSYAAADPADPTAPVCAGCSDPTCIVYQQAELDRSDGSSITILGEINRQWVTWQGGAVPGGGCPLAVPTQKASWGKLKSLYR